MAAGTFSFSIDLPIRSDWANVDLMRTSVQNCFTAIFSDIDGCHALAMVTGPSIRYTGPSRTMRAAGPLTSSALLPRAAVSSPYSCR